MVPWRATDDGIVTPEILAWYRRFAEGLPGAIVVEATGIRDIRSGPLLRIGHDRFLPGLRELVREVREASGGQTKLLIQIIDFLTIRRRPEPEKYFRSYLALTHLHRQRLASKDQNAHWLTASEQEVRERFLTLPHEDRLSLLEPREQEDVEKGYRERVTDTHLEHIRSLPEALPGLFAGAARRAQVAGFDGVELHFAHAYTMASFLSRLNMRCDGYGGSEVGRLRLPLEVLEAVRRRVGDDYCIGIRYLGDEVIEGGSRLDEAVAYGVAFAEHGADYLSVSKGGKFEDAKKPAIGEAAYPYTGPSGHECMPTVRIDARGPFARNLPLVSAIRTAIRSRHRATPIVAAGGLCAFEQIEGILRRGEADIIAAARQSLADPDWWLKMELGRGDEVRRCVYTNYCEGLDQRHKQVTCKLWDREFEPGEAIMKSHDGRRRLTAPEWR